MLKKVSESEFEGAIAEGVVLVDFYSNSCGPCKLYAKVLEKVAFDLPLIDIVKVCGDDDPAVLDRYNVEAVPTTMIFRDGQLMERFLGLRDETFVREKIGAYLYG